MALYLFRTPVRVVDGPRTVTIPNRRTDYDDGTLRGNVLMRHYKRPGQAVCVIIDQDRTVREKQVPLQTELVASLYHYLGGHDYMVTDIEAAMLTAAGYSVSGYAGGGYVDFYLDYYT